MRPTERIFVACDDYAAELVTELRHAGGPVREIGEGLYAAPATDAAWAKNTWLEPRVIAFESIADAARKLRALQRNWTLHPLANVRRSRLIEERLPHFAGKPLAFGEPTPSAPIGAWTLLDREQLLASPTTARPFPHGEARFVEDRSGPPSRAYLKLWEALTLRGERPQAGERCLDLGSSPGGWTWVCAQLGAEVWSVDKAPLDPRVAAMPGVRHLAQSAFALEPSEIGHADWLLSDVVCYPQRLLALVKRWREAGAATRYVCTLKFQGETDHAVAREFAAIEGSRLLHLSHNKHELTWML